MVKPKSQFVNYISSFEQHTNSIISIKISEKKVFSLSKDKSISIFNPEVNRLEPGFGFATAPTCMTMSVNKGILICGFEDGYCNVV